MAAGFAAASGLARGRRRRLSGFPVRAAGALVLAALAGCHIPHERVRERVPLDEWSAERATYPLVEPCASRRATPTSAGEIAVRFLDTEHALAFALDGAAAGAGAGAPPRAGLVPLARLSVLRAPLPDHAGALAELRGLAAQQGAAELVDVAYTVVTGPRAVGGAPLLGFVYVATALGPEPVDGR